MGKVRDLTGMRFGRLVVIEFSHLNRHRSAVWKCKCDCGKVITAIGYKMVSGHTSSCGCYQKIMASQANLKYSDKELLEEHKKDYWVWSAIKNRCFNSKYRHYNDYGGRGITMCQEWRENFIAFLTYMGPKPDNSCRYTVGRINNDGNYEPWNVRWETYKQQIRNRRLNKNNKSGIRGVFWREPYKHSLYCTATVCDGQGKVLSKSYRVGKYGIIPAMCLAIEWRENKLKEYGIVSG